VNQDIYGIKGLSDQIRLPRRGRIRLGEKQVSPKTGAEYPKKLDYFLCPEEVQEVYEEKPRELDILFPTNNVRAFWDQSYTRYGANGWLCRGDGERAIERETGELADCPCDYLNDDASKALGLSGAQCKRQGRLQFILFNVPGSLGVYEIATSSINSILNINSGLAMLANYLSGLKRSTTQIPAVRLRNLQRISCG